MIWNAKGVRDMEHVVFVIWSNYVARDMDTFGVVIWKVALRLTL